MRRSTHCRESRSWSSATSTRCRTPWRSRRRSAHVSSSSRMPPAIPSARHSAVNQGCAKVMEGKESLSVDLKSAEGRSIVHELIERANAFVLGFRPGVAERLGIDFATLSAINPQLVYVHAAGYGESGPYAHRPVYATTAMALAGKRRRATRVPGWTRGSPTASVSPSSRPSSRRISGASSTATPTPRSPRALRSCSGSCTSAAPARASSFATSMIGGNLYAYTDDAMTYEGKPPLPAPDTEQYGLGALYRLYRAQDGWVFLAATDDAEWSALVRVVGRPELAGDSRFATCGGSPRPRRRAGLGAAGGLRSSTSGRMGALADRGGRRLLSRLPVGLSDGEPPGVRRRGPGNARDGHERRHRASDVRHHSPTWPAGALLRDTRADRHELPARRTHHCDPDGARILAGRHREVR